MLDKNYDEERLSEEEMDKLADEGEAIRDYQEQRANELERHGYASEAEFEDAYYAGEADSDLGEPAMHIEEDEEESENTYDSKDDSSSSEKYVGWWNATLSC